MEPMGNPNFGSLGCQASCDGQRCGKALTVRRGMGLLQNAGLRGLGFIIRGLGFRVYNSGFRVYGSLGFIIRGLVPRICEVPIAMKCSETPS